MQFRAIIQLSGKTATGIEVPEEVVTSLQSGKRPPVSITVNGHTYRSSVAVMNGKFMVGISAENREAAGVNAGDEVDVNVELDRVAREVTVPADLTAALKLNADAKRFFEGLSYSNKLRHVLSVEQAKTAETRQRRIDKVVGMMQEGKV